MSLLRNDSMIPTRLALLALVAALLAAAPLVRAQGDLSDQLLASCQGRVAGTSVASQVAACDALIASNPDANTAALAYMRRANIYVGLREFDRAVADLNQALVLFPNDGLLLYRRCSARAFSGRELDLAFADCDAVVRSQPNSAMGHDGRGFVLLRLGRYDEAIRDYDRSLEINSAPNALQASSLFGRGVAETRKGDVSDGATDIQLATSIGPRIADVFASYGVSP